MRPYRTFVPRGSFLRLKVGFISHQCKGCWLIVAFGDIVEGVEYVVHGATGDHSH